MTVGEEPARSIPRAQGHEPLPLSSVVLYASPTLALAFVGALTTTYYVKYATDVLLVAPSAIGVVYGLARLWEAVCDPLTGFLSDRTRHALGRRRSWIAFASVPFCAFVLMGWAPPSSLAGMSLLVWVAIASFGVATSTSAIQIPHGALGAELSPESGDRTRLFATNGVMAMLGSFAALALGLRLIRTADEPRAAALALFGVASVALLALVASMVLRSQEPSGHQGRGGESAFRAYIDVWRNPHARVLILVGIFVQVTWSAMGTAAVFMLQYVLGVADSTELFMVSYFIPILLSVPLWVGLTGRFEKRHLWMACMVGSAVGFGSMAFVPVGAPLPGILALGVLIGVCGGGMFVFEPSIRAEVIDYDEFETGERKEGVYSAASHLFGKAAGAGMTMAVGLSLDAAGYVPNVEQTEAVKTVIRVLFGVIPAIAFVGALVLLSRFRLTEQVHAEVRRELDRRANEPHAS